MGDEREGRRKSLMGAGPLLGQLHFLPSVEAERTGVCTKGRKICMQVIHNTVYSLINKYDMEYSPCVGVEAVKGQTGSKE